MEELKVKRAHALTLSGQKHMEIIGVVSVDSFTDTVVRLKTEQSRLQILGIHLTMNKFDVDQGIVVLDGEIYEVKYATATDKTGFFKKLFQ